MKNKKRKWALMENGYVHTDGLNELDAIEMLERYQRIFPENDYSITQYY